MDDIETGQAFLDTLSRLVVQKIGSYQSPPFWPHRSRSLPQVMLGVVPPQMREQRDREADVLALIGARETVALGAKPPVRIVVAIEQVRMLKAEVRTTARDIRSR